MAKQKKGISLDDIRQISEVIYELSHIIGSELAKDYGAKCVVACLRQVKAKCDRKLADGVWRQRYSIKLTEPELMACYALGEILNMASYTEAHNSIIRLLKQQNK